MKKFLALAGLITLFANACRKIEMDNYIIGDGNGGGADSNQSTLLEGKITSDRTLKSNLVYKLRGIVYVTGGAKLIIEPGTIIMGESASKGSLVITKGSQIIADGTKENPIVFTSDAATPKRGDWGGVVICGNAKTNASFNGQSGIGQVEGGVNNGEGLGLYGGTDDNDNSGILRYVRIEYAGYAYLPDNELNGLTLAGVGSGTTVDYVEIYKANDDAIECFGGNVNLKHTIFISTLDDDFDTDNGYSGKVQFGIIMRDSSIADISKSESWESDNDANGSALLPQTSAVYSNITVIGPRATTANIGNSLFLAGAQIRRNSSISIFNSVILGYPTGILIDASKGIPTDNNIRLNTLMIQNTFVAGCVNAVDYAANPTPTGWIVDSAIAWFNSPDFGNKTFSTVDQLQLTAAFNYLNPDFTPMAGSPLLNAASFSNTKLQGFTTVDYVGAVGPAGSEDADWWKGWSILDLNL
ncbi:MAG: hypothetical protein JST21_15705 [Bacteroidetes bacterium]|nr:hypothetical protein [Bacteroidota bacterium]